MDVICDAGLEISSHICSVIRFSIAVKHYKLFTFVLSCVKNTWFRKRKCRELLTPASLKGRLCSVVCLSDFHVLMVETELDDI